MEKVGQSRALALMEVTRSRVNSHVSKCARTTLAAKRGSSSSSRAAARSADLHVLDCCIAARIRAFSRFGTRPNRTAVTKQKSDINRQSTLRPLPSSVTHLLYIPFLYFFHYPIVLLYFPYFFYYYIISLHFFYFVIIILLLCFLYFYLLFSTFSLLLYFFFLYIIIIFIFYLD